MKEQIVEELGHFGTTLGAEILFACESGSRGWNFASKDSDYDVRFIYRKSLDHYLDLFPGADTMEASLLTNPVLDFQGWDWNKAILLAAKSNPSLLEWLQSDIYYVKEHPAVTLLRRFMQENYSARALAYHYVSLAERQYKSYWKPGEPVTFKKYLYAVRPLLCVEWMMNNEWQLPPMDFNVLREDDMMLFLENKELDDLLQRKAEGREKEGGRYAHLDAYIEDGIPAGRKVAATAPANRINTSFLQDIFLYGLGSDYQSM